MVKNKMVIIRITEEQNRLLLEKTHKTGFMKKADYVRNILFTELNTEDKINKIYEKVCKNG